MIPAISLVAGIALAAAFAPLGLWWLAPIALAIWFVQVTRVDSRRAFWSGWFFGAGFFGAGVHWVFHSLLVFGEAPLVVASLATALLVAALSFYPALMAGLSVRAREWVSQRVSDRAVTRTSRPDVGGVFGGVALVPLLALGWVAAELARSSWFSGFPWLLVGHSLLDSPYAPWLSLAGESGAALLVVAVASLLAWMLIARRWWRLAAAAALALLLAAGSLVPHASVTPIGDAVSVGLVQGNIEQESKWAEDGVDVALERYLSMSEALVGTQVIVWPETAIPDFYFQVYGPLEEAAFAWREQGSELVTGVFDYDPVEDRMFNSIRHVPSGAVYDKRQLVPFGEYMPLRAFLAWLDALLGIPMADLSPGTGDGLIEIAGVPMGLSVCYESAFARHMRAPLPDARVLLNVSNDAWFARSAAPYQHLQIARVRALELGRPMIRSTNTGVSAFIDHRGRVTDELGLFLTGTLVGEVQPMSGSTPAVRFGALVGLAVALFWPALLVVMFGWGLWRRRRSA